MGVIIHDYGNSILPVNKNDHIRPDMNITTFNNESLSIELTLLLTKLPIATGSREFAVIQEAAERIKSWS